MSQRIEQLATKVGQVFSKLLLACLGTIAGLVLGEMALRIFLPLDLQPVETLAAMPSYEMIYRHKPNSEWYSHSPTNEFSVHIKINSQGLRDYEYSREKAENVFRIAIVGDSLAEARQVELDQTFSKLLETELTIQNIFAKDYDSIEVINFGVSGYSTDEELIRIQADVLDYCPDLVMIVFVNNDLTNTLYNRLFYLDDNRQLVMRSFSKSRKRDLLVGIFGRLHWFYYGRKVLTNYPAAYDYVSLQINRYLGAVEGLNEQLATTEGNEEDLVKKYPSWISYYIKQYQSQPDLEEAFLLVEEIFKDIAELLGRKGIDLLVVHSTNSIRIDPSKPWNLRYLANYGLSEEDMDVTLPYKRMSEIWTRLGIKHLDLTKFLETEPDKGVELHLRDDGHLSVQGHRYFRKHILAYLLDNKLVFSNSTPASEGTRFTAEQAFAARWLQENAPQGAVVAGDNYSQEGMDFFLDGVISLFEPITTLDWSEGSFQPLKPRVDNHPVYLMSSKRLRRGGKDNLVFFMVFQEDIMAAIEKKKIDYLMIAGNGGYLTRYLQQVPWAELRFQQGGVYVYEIRRSDPDFGIIDDLEGESLLYARSGDGTIARFNIDSKYRQYELSGKASNYDHMYMYLGESGTFYLDSVAFSVLIEDGSEVNLLSDSNSGFESDDIDWLGQGNHSVQRVDEPNEGQSALKVVAAGPGDSANRINLNNSRYEAYEPGRANNLRFFAKTASTRKSFCVNQSLAGDLVWLKQNYLEEYGRLVKVFDSIGLELREIAETSCRIPSGLTP